ncbi:metallo-beta-lactamase domain protein [Dictyocaulus viviparus]|uniref:Beta-lactamase-like protein 2 homolog n=1 Tax=Dictyocaulus viviparus TaxID=29172 RepID=A0A0D8XJE1_DICVI|nr:metallo-beta-lactamase domain protein [Dictyocaulus viviparus]
MTSYINGLAASLRYAKEFVIAASAYLFASKTHSAMPTLTPLDAVSHLDPLVIRILGQNPGPFTLQGTNTYLVGAGKRKILIDTGEPNIQQYIALLRSTLAEEQCEIDSIIITHWHHDHVGGINNVLKEVIGHEMFWSVPVWSENSTISHRQSSIWDFERKKVPVYKIKREAGEDASQFHYVEDGHAVHVDGATLRFVKTPGHTSDHASLWLEEEHVLFSGDCILGEGTTVFEDLYDYMNSLGKIKVLYPKRIYPGHGPVVEKCEQKVDEYIQHRMKRENQIIETLQKLGEATSMDITVAVYSDSPLSVRLAALNNVKLHLNKLIKDEQVEMSSFGVYRLLRKHVKVTVIFDLNSPQMNLLKKLASTDF